jgi:biotin carboxyl carrier protein
MSSRQRSTWPLIVVAALFIIVPFLTWYLTWFGRDLSDEQIAKYLAEENNPRHTQHALSRIVDRINKGDSGVSKFYPQIVVLASSPVAEIRKTAAWAMGQDNSSEEFHQALLKLLEDSEPLVRRNAALQLVRFGDTRGRPELRAMLQMFAVISPAAGKIKSSLTEGSAVKSGALVARLGDSERMQDIRSPVDGEVNKVLKREGDQVSAGDTIVLIAPDRTSAAEALRALYYVGSRDDLEFIEPYAQGAATADQDLNRQAVLTVEAIRERAERTP